MWWLLILGLTSSELEHVKRCAAKACAEHWEKKFEPCCHSVVKYRHADFEELTHAWRRISSMERGDHIRCFHALDQCAP